MPNSKKLATPDPFAFLAGLQSLLDLLPSQEQHNEATATFNKLIHFFTDLRDKFSALPTREESADIQESLVRLEELLHQAEKSPAIAQSVGIRQQPKKAGTRTTPPQDSEIDVSALVKIIRYLSADDIKSYLDGKQYSVLAIKQLALALGMKPTSKASKTLLVSQIVNYIENARMSDRLAGRTESEWLPIKQEEGKHKESAESSS